MSFSEPCKCLSFFFFPVFINQAQSLIPGLHFLSKAFITHLHPEDSSPSSSRMPRKGGSHPPTLSLYHNLKNYTETDPQGSKIDKRRRGPQRPREPSFGLVVSWCLEEWPWSLPSCSTCGNGSVKKLMLSLQASSQPKEEKQHASVWPPEEMASARLCGRMTVNLFTRKRIQM